MPQGAYRPILWTLLFLALFLITCADALAYVPGLAPTARRGHDPARAEVNGLHSTLGGVPYPFYDSRTPFCQPIVGGATDPLQHFSHSIGIGALLSGERPQWSGYVLYTLENSCESVSCEREVAVTAEHVRWMRELIEKSYRAHILLDNLPAYNDGQPMLQGACRSGYYKKRPSSADLQRGFYLGVPSECTGGAVYLNNHLHFVVHYHSLTPEEAMQYEETDLTDGSRVLRMRRRRAQKMKSLKRRKSNNTNNSNNVPLPDDLDTAEGEETGDLFLVVNVLVYPFSIDWSKEFSDNGTVCGMDAETGTGDINLIKLMEMTQYLVLDETLVGHPVHWTYSAEWHENTEVKWATRWDAYFAMSKPTQNGGAHYLSIVYSLLLVLALASTVAMVILRALRRDLSQYSALLDIAREPHEVAEEHGWKAVRNDVFRLPPRAEDLVLLVASGTEVLFAVSGTLFVALLGYCSPANRGGLLSFLLFQFMLSSVAGGFMVSFLTSLLGVSGAWGIVAKLVCALPGLVLGTFLFCNTVLRVVRSTGAVPSSAIAMLFLMWLCSLVPLSFLGAKMGFACGLSPTKRRVGTLPRPIDKANVPLCLHTTYLLLYTGFSPLLVAMFEIHLIMESLYKGLTYQFFGFLTVVFVLWSIACGLTSVCAVYYRLCAEDYRWWWVSFFAPSSVGLHLFLWTLFSYSSNLQMSSTAATMLYFAYMSLITVLYVLCSGAIGFLSSWAFVSVIFTAVKFD